MSVNLFENWAQAVLQTQCIWSKFLIFDLWCLNGRAALPQPLPQSAQPNGIVVPLRRRKSKGAAADARAAADAH